MATMRSDGSCLSLEAIEKLIFEAAYQRPLEFSAWRQRMVASNFLFASCQQQELSSSERTDVTPLVDNTTKADDDSSKKKRRCPIIILKSSSRCRSGSKSESGLKKDDGKEGVVGGGDPKSVIPIPPLKKADGLAPITSGNNYKKCEGVVGGGGSKSVIPPLKKVDDPATIASAKNALKRSRPADDETETKLEASRKKLQYRYQQALNNRKKIMVLDADKPLPPTSRQVFSHGHSHRHSHSSRLVSCV